MPAYQDYDFHHLQNQLDEQYKQARNQIKADIYSLVE